ADETKALAKTIDVLNARLNVIESAKSHDELVELRHSVGEIRSNVASSRDLTGTLAQRVEKLDRDESAKVDKLNERVDRETSAQAAELAARIDRLEKKVVASAA